MKKLFALLIILTGLPLMFACHSGSPDKSVINQGDFMNLEKKDTSSPTSNRDTVAANTVQKKISPANKAKVDLPVVFIYNFHVTNRCPSCIAIEEATTKTLNTYFAADMKQGRIKRQVLNVDEVLNKVIAEKYQAFGSGLFVTRVFKGVETTTDLTGDGFKYAKNKEEKFIEILKNQITTYLK